MQKLSAELTSIQTVIGGLREWIVTQDANYYGRMDSARIGNYSAYEGLSKASAALQDAQTQLSRVIAALDEYIPDE